MSRHGVTIERLGDLPAPARAEGVRLYWLAFRDKLGRLLGPDARALALLDRVARADHALVAVTGAGQVVGIAGFRSPAGSFVALGGGQLRAVYGPLGGSLRAGLIRWLSAEVDNERFLIDGLAVAPGMRRQGIGAALIEALAAEARARGYAAMRLDVADGNRQARALYDRAGFEPARHDRLRLLAPVFGMRGSTMMIKRL